MNSPYSATVYFLLFLFSGGLFAQTLSPTEQRIVTSVRENHQDAVAMLERVVNINSGTLNLAGVQEVGSVFDAAFRQIGFSTRWVDMPAAMNRAGHFFAETKGERGKKLLLIGHLDTVFEPDSPFQGFKMLNDSVAAAPGGNDMKGGDIIILYALKALRENGLLDDAQIIVALTGDEESTGKPLTVSRRDLIEAARRSDIALGFETASGASYATVARRGSSGWRLEVDGRRAHSSGIFRKKTGAGAIFEAARILDDFYDQVRGEEYLTFNPGMILGGSEVDVDPSGVSGRAAGKSNVVASKVVVTGGLRTISAEQLQRARQSMRAVVARHLPQTSATITFTDSYPSMPPTEGNLALLETLSQVSQDLGQGEVLAYDPGKRGAADLSFVAEYVDGLDGLGATGSGAHSLEETVDLHTFEAMTLRTALFIWRLIQ